MVLPGSKKPGIDNRLPTCRNYWRFGNPTASPPQRPPAYLLKPHLIASTLSVSDGVGTNPNAKYHKLRHGLGASQFSPLSDEMMNYHQYRVRLPFDPSPFRGVTRFAFWIMFLAILILLLVLLTSLFSVEDFHAQDTESVTNENDSQSHKSLGSSLIFKTLLNRN